MIGKILGNRYEIVEKIGGGGMAVVYKAKCNLLNRFVAVKILRSEFTSDKDLLDKFRKESQAAASLSHPNIVNIYDVGEEDDSIYYIVMEYVDGKTLKDVIKEKAPLSLNEIVDYGKQIAYALKHAHNNHIVHRDIKPHNILVTSDNRAKVTDFGIALAATSSTITNAGSVIGSVHYFSPEQARGGYTDEKSDLYSLGIVMYEMATGRVPFEGDSPITVALKQIQEEPLEPSKLNEDVHDGLEKIIQKLMQKEQSARYQNTQELIEDLKQLKNDPTTRYFPSRVSEVDSPTQIIPKVTEEAYGKSTKEINNYEDTKLGKRNKKDNDDKKTNKWIVAGAIVAALIAAFLFTFGFFYQGNWFTTPDVTVPNLVGMDIDEAKEMMADLDVELVVQEKFDVEVPVDHIIHQSPVEGRTVKKGGQVKVQVSLGSRLVNVPTLEMKNAIDAGIILRGASLVEGEAEEEYHDSLPIGVIIRQNPRAGLEVPEGSAVDYVVSLGPQIQTILMPNLVGTNIETGKRTLQQLGLEVGTIAERPSDEYDKDEIIEQSVAETTEVEEGTVVNLVVSLGPEEEIEDTEEEEANETSVTLVDRYINVDLNGYSGNVDIIIYQISNDGRRVVFNKRHNINRDGNNVRALVQGNEGSGAHRFEVYVNNEFHSDVNTVF
ncbi:Stk1 family PASTA domain-containing Ser/Thr kinase [Alkaliphilus peptidifermentans]|uniref:non-specific serine/threonine protein kinase n=1 Tax=Alkaliphilus peptidifermentans DSM 18978 TaxID=1120976 RepID=A0A1G5JAB2_9FIRM|nr:Stk1 family PASTA domain-containing Ser/Thr kinase [Alkaliphilus peptidifermentans]SCY85313.1 serine/threonine protein kinase [Alkaliphilus peptidifermentans DSM 18978]